MRAIYFSVGLVSAVFIALQLNLVRILSTLLSYHFVFSVVSLAMLGLGLGGLIVQRIGQHAPEKNLLFFLWASFVSAVAALGMIVWMGGQSLFFTHYYAYFLVVLVPFTFGGAFFAQAYRRFSACGSQLYAADLLGAALGCVGGVWLLNVLGALNGILVLAALLGAVLWLLPQKRGPGAWLALFLAALCLVWGGLQQHIAPAWLQLADRNPDKEISDALTGPLQGEVTRQKWTAFGLTEQVEYRNTDEHRDIYIDGTAGTPMYQFSGDFRQPGTAVEKLFRFFPGAVPFQAIAPENKGRALIIGPGGGRDILLAAGAGFEEVMGVEVNADLLAMVRQQAEFNGGLYTDFDHIQLQQAEGRHFVQRDPGHYDLIMLSLPVTNTSRSPEGFALTENFLLTAEAIEDYLQHLTPRGQLIIITHDELAVLRLIMTALPAYEALGLDVTEAFERFYVLGSFPYPIVVFAREPFAPQTSMQLLQQSLQRDYSMNASYFPQLIGPGRGNPMLQALATGDATVDEVQAHIHGMGFDVSSITDDRPFFYHFETEPPRTLSGLFYIALAISALVWFWSALIGLRGAPGGPRVRLPALSTAFMGLGAGFMLMEIIFVQKLTFYLGNPVLALAVLLTVLLAGMAAGSQLTARVRDERLRQRAVAAAILVVIVGALYQWVLPALLQATLVWSANARLLFGSVLLVPLGLALGLCFPLLIRLLSTQQRAQFIPWMWAINGCASVSGASAAVLGALSLGFQNMLWLGLLLYLLVAISLLLIRD